MIKKLLSFIFLLSIVTITLELGYQVFWNIFNQQQSKTDTQICTLGMDLAITIILFVFSIIFNNTCFLDAYYYLGPLYRTVKFFVANSNEPLIKEIKQKEQIPGEREEFIENLGMDVQLKKFIVVLFVVFFCLAGFFNSFKNWKGFPFQDKNTTQG